MIVSTTGTLPDLRLTISGVTTSEGVDDLTKKLCQALPPRMYLSSIKDISTVAKAVCCSFQPGSQGTWSLDIWQGKVSRLISYTVAPHQNDGTLWYNLRGTMIL